MPHSVLSETVFFPVVLIVSCAPLSISIAVIETNMARLLFKLANVPDDEAEEIRALLSDNNIAFYETDAGFWRVGLDAIWLPNSEQEAQARELIGTYQQQRRAHQQAVYAELAEQGDIPSVWQRAAQHPLRFAGLVLAIVFVLGLTLMPFVMLALA